MSFAVKITITPDSDGRHCGKCNICAFNNISLLGWPFHIFSCELVATETWKDIRSPACLEAEKKAAP